MMRQIQAGAAALMLAACATAPSQPSQTESTRAVVAAFMDQFCTHRQVRAAFERYVAPGYIQHNPLAADGRDAAIAALSGFLDAQPDARCEIKRIIVDGDLAAVHAHVRLNAQDRGAAVVDMFRVENGLIAEHWDVVQPVPEQSANPHPMF